VALLARARATLALWARLGKLRRERELEAAHAPAPPPRSTSMSTRPPGVM
jgi:hypothetical protein